MKKSSIKECLLRVSKELYADRQLKDGSIATISPTPDGLIALVMTDLESIIHSSQYICVCDLGCGDGRWLTAFLASTAFNNRCIVYGLELDDERIQKTMANVMLNKQQDVVCKNYEIIQCDFINQFHLRMMDVVIVYLSVVGNSKIKEKIRTECSAGTVLIAVGFQIKDMTPIKMYSSNSLNCYMYAI